MPPNGSGELPDKDLAYFTEGAEHFDDYVFAVGWAQRFARCNRDLMMAQVLDAMAREGLPPWCYTSEAFRAREIQRLFYPNWLVVGRADQIQNSGDYLARQIAGVPVLVIRGRDGEVRAFANTCRHRGARLLSEENGNCRAVKCPYHG